MYKDILVDINNIDSNLTALEKDADNNDTHQQATSNNVTTESDPALEYDARENDKLNINKEENGDPLNEFIIKFAYNARCHWLKERAL